MYPQFQNQVNIQFFLADLINNDINNNQYQKMLNLYVAFEIQKNLQWNLRKSMLTKVYVKIFFFKSVCVYIVNYIRAHRIFCSLIPEMLLAFTSCAQSSITDWGTSSNVSF